MPMSLGDLAALAKPFEEHRPKLRAMVERRIDPALAARIGADDILHDAYCAAQRRWEGGERLPESPYPWFYRIVLDRLIDAWRREAGAGRDLRREMPWPERSSVQLGLRLVDTATSPSRAFSREERRQRVRQLVGLLKPGDQEILWMRHEDDLSFPEIAAVLGLNADAAAQRYVRALKRFKALWQELSERDGAE